MRKALIGMILAATAMTPVAAWAQDDDGGRGERIRQRMEQRQQARTERQEARTERQEARTERRVERTEVRQQRSEPQVQQVPASMQSRAVNRRGERNLQRAANGGGAVADQNRQEWRRERREDRQDSRQERREDRQDWRQDRREDRQDWRRNRQDDGSQSRQDWQRRGEWRDGRDGRNEGRSDGRNWQNQRRDWSRNWDRNSWRNDRRYDWQNWRSRNRNIFRTSPYYSPYRNHRYSRFSIGVFLQPLFYGRNYWIGDPYQYRLPYAPPGTQWVRYYNDVLLVDTWSGEVIDVIYNFFW